MIAIVLVVIIVIILIVIAGNYSGGKELKITLSDSTLIDAIIDGTKTVEGRKNSRHFENLKAKDDFIFRVGDRQLQCKVVKVTPYESIEEFFDSEGVENVLPGVPLDKAIESYRILNKVDDTEAIKKIADEKDGKWFLGIKFKFIKEL